MASVTLVSVEKYRGFRTQIRYGSKVANKKRAP
jgi:hypothetical protein